MTWRAPLTILLALPWMSLAAQEVYKWTDENGVVHFAPQKPEGVEAQSIRIKGDSDPVAPADESVTADSPEVVAVTAEPTELEKRSEAQRKSLCNRAFDSLNALTSGQRVFKSDSSGVQSVLRGAEREAAIEESRRNVEKYCDPKPPA
jgi:hypothetical protein